MQKLRLRHYVATKPPELNRWIDLWHQLGANGNPLPWYEELASRYSEPHRHYHNFRHLTNCLSEFDSARDLARSPLALEFAIWFHDAIYEPRVSNNEEESAALATKCLSAAGAGAELHRSIPLLVMATKTHDPSMHPDAPLLVDVDLSILGQSASCFEEYEIQIRGEYCWVPVGVFAAKRSEILRRFLSRERIYTTDRFFNKYEAQARLNLRNSLSQLAAIRPA